MGGWRSTPIVLARRLRGAGYPNGRLGGASNVPPPMLSGLRHFFSNGGHGLSERRWRALAAVAALLAIGAAAVGAYLVITDDGDEPTPSAAPQVVVQEVSSPKATEELGFPAFATTNTTRVAGMDPIADAAGVALAVYPSAGGVPGPAAVTLVDAADWPAAIAAASLMADPVGAPILFTEGGEVGELTADAIGALAPSGSPETDDRQAFRIGAAGRPDGLSTFDVDGANAAELAVGIARLRARLQGGDPQHLLVASADEPAFAMPAAAWAARSGDPVLFVRRNAAPAATLDALRDYDGVPAYVLGPESAISAGAMEQIKKVAPEAQRVGADDPVTNAIAFARFADGTFGWNINDPGHGLVLASADRPLDAAAAAPLSASGSWGPLLISDNARGVPAQLRGYLLDLKPGYENDPTRAVYNHAWLIGDTSVLDVAFQAQVDELIALAPIRSGRGAAQLAPPPGPAEPKGRGGPGGQQSQGARD
jgi:ell wall binding domain 2 (CWB2)